MTAIVRTSLTGLLKDAALLEKSLGGADKSSRATLEDARRILGVAMDPQQYDLSGLDVGGARASSPMHRQSLRRLLSPSLGAPESPHAHAKPWLEETKIARSTKPKFDELKTETARAMFDRYDADDSGSLEYEEVAFALADMGALDSVLASAASDILAEFDSDGDGKINFDEFKVMVKKIKALTTAGGSRSLKKIVAVPDGYKDSDGALPVKSAFEGYVSMGKGNDYLSSKDWNRMVKACGLVGGLVNGTSADIVFAKSCTYGKKVLEWDDGSFLDALANLATEHKVTFGQVATRVAQCAPVGSPKLKPKAKPKAKKKAAFAAETIRAMFDRYDADGSGTLELTEVGFALADLGVMEDVLATQAAELFEEFDDDDSGGLDVDEFEKLIQRVEELKEHLRTTGGTKKKNVAVPEGYSDSDAALPLKSAYEGFVVKGANKDSLGSVDFRKMCKACGLVGGQVSANAADLCFSKTAPTQFKSLSWDDGSFLRALALLATEHRVTFGQVASRVASCAPAGSPKLTPTNKTKKIEPIVFPPETIMAMFDRYDVDRSGALELTEVGYALHDLNVMDGVLTSDVAALFKEYDEDGNGDLDFHEFEKLVARINAQRGTATKKKLIVEVPEGFASSGAAAALKARFEEYATEKAHTTAFGVATRSELSIQIYEWSRLVKSCGLIGGEVTRTTADLIFCRIAPTGSHKDVRAAQGFLRWGDGTFLNALAAIATEHRVTFGQVAKRVEQCAPKLLKKKKVADNKKVVPEKLETTKSQYRAVEKESIEDMFRRYDVDRNGELDLGEATTALGDLGVLEGVLASAAAELFDEFDVDGDGTVGLDEFERLVAKVSTLRGSLDAAPKASVPEGFATTAGALALRASFEAFALYGKGSNPDPMYKEMLSSRDYMKMMVDCGLIGGAVTTTVVDLIFTRLTVAKQKDLRAARVRWDDGSFFEALAAVAVEHKATFGQVVSRVSQCRPQSNVKEDFKITGAADGKKERVAAASALDAAQQANGPAPPPEALTEANLLHIFNKYAEEYQTGDVLTPVDALHAFADVGLLRRMPLEVSQTAVTNAIADTAANGGADARVAFAPFLASARDLAAARPLTKYAPPGMDVRAGESVAEMHLQIGQREALFAAFRAFGGGPRGMTPSDWNGLVNACGLIGTKLSEASAAVVFAKCKQGAGLGVMAPKAMSFEGFVQACAHVAQEYDVAFDVVAQRVVKCAPETPKNGSDEITAEDAVADAAAGGDVAASATMASAVAAKTGGVPTTAEEAADRDPDDVPILPVPVSVPSEMRDDAPLRAAFAMFATHDREDVHPEMDLEGWAALVRGCGLIGGEVTEDLAREIWSQVVFGVPGAPLDTAHGRMRWGNFLPACAVVAKAHGVIFEVVASRLTAVAARQEAAAYEARREAEASGRIGTSLRDDGGLVEKAASQRSVRKLDSMFKEESSRSKKEAKAAAKAAAKAEKEAKKAAKKAAKGK